MPLGNNVTVRIDGLTALGTRMKALKTDMQKKSAWQAAGRGAAVVKKAAQVIHRANTEKSTGTLEAALVAKRVPAGQRRYTAEYWVTVRRGLTNKARKAGKQRAAPYAGYLEFGTIKMNAEPFLRPALANNVQRVGEAMRDKLAKAIAKFSK